MSIKLLIIVGFEIKYLNSRGPVSYKCGKSLNSYLRSQVLFPERLRGICNGCSETNAIFPQNNIVVRPVVVCGSECWVLTENFKQKLLVFERKILRRIFGPTQKASGELRLKTNEELEKAINNENIVRYIKYKRLSWLGHVERMANERVAKTIHKWKPYATKPKGRP